MPTPCGGGYAVWDAASRSTVCRCAAGYALDGSGKCTVSRCPAACNPLGGKCLGGQCVCEEGWTGSQCQTPRCSLQTSCDRCSALSGCGWCESQGTCQPGGFNGPDSPGAVCSSWFFDECRAVVSASTPTAASWCGTDIRVIQCADVCAQYGAASAPCSDCESVASLFQVGNTNDDVQLVPALPASGSRFVDPNPPMPAGPDGQACPSLVRPLPETALAFGSLLRLHRRFDLAALSIGSHADDGLFAQCTAQRRSCVGGADCYDAQPASGSEGEGSSTWALRNGAYASRTGSRTRNREQAITYGSGSASDARDACASGFVACAVDACVAEHGVYGIVAQDGASADALRRCAARAHQLAQVWGADGNLASEWQHSQRGICGRECAGNAVDSPFLNFGRFRNAPDFGNAWRAAYADWLAFAERDTRHGHGLYSPTSGHCICDSGWRSAQPVPAHGIDGGRLCGRADCSHLNDCSGRGACVRRWSTLQYAPSNPVYYYERHFGPQTGRGRGQCMCQWPFFGASCQFRRRAFFGGDPHLVTNDGVRYDFMEAGTFVQCRGVAALGIDDFEVQGQAFAFGSDASMYNGVAVRLASDVKVEVQAARADITASQCDSDSLIQQLFPTVYINGVDQTISSGDTIYVVRQPQAAGIALSKVASGGTAPAASAGELVATLAYTSRLGEGNKAAQGFVTVTTPAKRALSLRMSFVYSPSVCRQFISLDTQLGPRFEGATEGLCGNSDGLAAGDLVGRGGATYNASVQSEVDAFGASWAVAAGSADDLFVAAASTRRLQLQRLLEHPEAVAAMEAHLAEGGDEHHDFIDPSAVAGARSLRGPAEMEVQQRRVLSLEPLSEDELLGYSLGRRDRARRLAINQTRAEQICRECGTPEASVANCAFDVIRTNDENLCHQESVSPVCSPDATCSNHGACINATCVCGSGFSGEACEVATCPGNCSSNGVCEGGICACDAGWDGLDCSTTSTCAGVNDCNGNGNCTAVDTCTCEAGKGGAGCDVELDCDTPALSDCSAHGTCGYSTLASAMQCSCDSSWGGADCATPLCTAFASCSSRGSCVVNASAALGQACECEQGWGGDDCAATDCAHLSECSAHGSCVDGGSTGGECECDSGWTGADCSTQPDCSAHANCNAGSDHGLCVVSGTEASCTCFAGWTGADCGTVDVVLNFLPSATPSASPSVSPSPSPSFSTGASPSATSSPAATATSSAASTPAATATSSAAATPAETPSPTASPSPSASAPAPEPAAGVATADSGLSGGEVAGAAVGGVLGVAAVGGVVFLAAGRLRRRKQVNKLKKKNRVSPVAGGQAAPVQVASATAVCTVEPFVSADEEGGGGGGGQ